MLRLGFGGLVLSAKEETATWAGYCVETGREEDLVIVNPENRWRLNPLQFELERGGRGAGRVENVVALLSSLMELASRGDGGRKAGGHSDRYWMLAAQQMLRNFASLLVIATGSVSLDALYRVVISAPQSPEQVMSPEWRGNSYCFSLLTAADRRLTSASISREFRLVSEYVLREFPALAERTRSVVVSSFTALGDILNRGDMHELFGGASNFSPRDSENGKIILCDLSVKEFGQVGLLANALLKHVWCASIERRDIAASPRPVFLFIDEANHFVNEHDVRFQTTCRSSRVATVLISQSLSNFRMALGREQADALLANLNTKLFHANGDPVTNEWAASLIGRSRQLMMNGGTSRPRFESVWDGLGFDRGEQSNAGFAEAFEWTVRPEEFQTLRTGGARHRGIVDAVAVRNGSPFRDTGTVWRVASIAQSARAESEGVER